MNIEKKLQELQARYEEITTALGDPAIYEKPEEYQKLSKEHSRLKDIVEDYQSWVQLNETINSNKELIQEGDEAELAEMAEAENKELIEKRDKLEEEIKIKLVPKDAEDSKNAIVEIRAGTGGDEAAIFAGDLYNMYRRYAESEGWKNELLDLQEAAHGGYKEIIFRLNGAEVFGKMKYESGVHRVQRVPDTESQGRVHTSAASVAVLPEAEEVDIKIDPSDLEFEAFRSSGAGGQHVNTTDSAVRIRHIPSGVVVSCQEERSQLKNREKAMTMLRSKLYEEELAKKHAERAEQRKSQVSTGDRSAKIRTYNFPQGRVTDHRINLTLYNLDDVIKGSLGDVIDALRTQDHLDRLNQMAENT